MTKITKGFTLIELIMVIVIVSCLSAMAIPRYLDLKSEAKVARMKDFAAALNAAVSMAKMSWSLKGQPTSLQLPDGNTVLFTNGIPSPMEVDKLMVPGFDAGLTVVTRSSKFVMWCLPNDSGACSTTTRGCSVMYGMSPTYAQGDFLIDTSTVTVTNCK